MLDQITFLTTRLPQLFWDFGTNKMIHIFLIHILKFGRVPKLSIYKEIIKNVSNNNKSVVTTLNKTLNNISGIFPYYFKTRYKSVVFSLWMSYLHENWPLLKFKQNLFSKIIWSSTFKYKTRHPLEIIRRKCGKQQTSKPVDSKSGV